jgi:hypothetical protein
MIINMKFFSPFFDRGSVVGPDRAAWFRGKNRGVAVFSLRRAITVGNHHFHERRGMRPPHAVGEGIHGVA